MAKKGPSADELRQQCTDRLIVAMKDGKLPWRKPWLCDPNAGAPTNIVSKKRYRGVNPWMLDLTASEFSYDAKWWGTYKQWATKHGQVRKGEKSSLIVFWKIIQPDGLKDDGSAKDKIFFLRHSRVFNLSQVDNAEGKTNLDKYRVDREATHTDFDPDVFEPAEAVITELDIETKYGCQQACYVPSGDRIEMPHRNQFELLQRYYQTHFHEIAHWAERRTGLTKKQESKQKRDYAFAELVAEIAGCYCCSEIGVPITSGGEFDESAAYLTNWLKALQDDPKFIFDASKWASKATDMILGDEVDAESYNDEPDAEPKTRQKKAA